MTTETERTITSKCSAFDVSNSDRKNDGGEKSPIEGRMFNAFNAIWNGD
jgi:hypothetical protein